MIGSYYTYDEPASMKNQIDDYMGDPADYETMYSLFYSVYSFPNIILPFFGGYLVDRFRPRNCQVLYALLIVIGNLVFALGMTAKLWWVMYIGRAIHGMGGISICVATSATIAQWFSGKELAFAFGFNLSLCRLGSVINNLVSPQIAAAQGVPTALWFGFILCILSFLCAVAVVPMEVYLEERIEHTVADSSGGQESQSLLDNAHSSSVGEDKETVGKPLTTYAAAGSEVDADAGEHSAASQWATVKSLSPLFWMLCLICVCVYGCVFPFNNIESTLLLERDYFKEQPNSQCALTYDAPGLCQNATNVPNEYCNDGQWYQPPVAMGAEVNCASDSSGCYDEYCDTQQNSEIHAATIMSIPYIIVAVFCPIFGGLTDIYGQRATLLALAPAILVVVHACVGLTDISIVALLVGQGAAYCLFAAVLWPSISLVLRPENLGIGYGFVFAIQNTGNAVFPLLIAQVYMNSGERYVPNVEMVFVALSVLATSIGLALCYYDYHHGGVFNSPSGRPVGVGTVDDDEKEKDGVDWRRHSDSGTATGTRGPGSVAVFNSADATTSPLGSPPRHSRSSRDSRDGRALSTSSVTSVHLT